MGIWRFVEAFTVEPTQKPMRVQNLQNARQPANGHRRVLGVRSFCFSVV